MPLPIVPKSNQRSYFCHHRLVFLILESHIMESHDKCSFESGLLNIILVRVACITAHSSNMFFLLAMQCVNVPQFIYLLYCRGSFELFLFGASMKKDDTFIPVF